VGALRCVLERRPLAEAADGVAEGGMLLSSNVAPGGRRNRSVRRGAAVSSHSPIPSPASGKTCPIVGCGRTFAQGRSGWDGHVGSLRLHPSWHPTLTDPDERRARFREEFSEWLR
jgi:hypothetical protein